MDEQERPQKSAGDVAHALLKASISTIPIAGAPAAMKQIPLIGE